MALAELLNRLDGDEWRKQNAFSSDISISSEVLLHPYARDDEQQLAAKAWISKFQPCVFGQVAARANSLYIAVVTDADMSEGDDALRERLDLEKKTWKQWSLEGGGRHGFLVIFASPKLHHAAPNQALKEVSEYLRGLFVQPPTKDTAGNDVCHEWLYLKRPNSVEYVKFRVILDYFASAGDKRWWHDHRFPGGIAFTLNSVGHMVRTKEWYENLKNPVEWSARMAMLTISNAFEHPEFGKATHLLDLQDGKPLKQHECPFSSADKIHERLRGKDWTTYSGSHHTDHSVRAEFFDQHTAPDRDHGEYLLDFTYLSGDSEGENAELTNGVSVTKDEMLKDVGSPDSWRRKKPARYAISPRPPDAEIEIEKALSICRTWFDETSDVDRQMPR
jgi:hypothetical protein